jgi:hypothetical protein
MKYRITNFRGLLNGLAALAAALLFAFVPKPALAQAPAWQWANSLCLGNATATVTDNAGNVYVTGQFNGTATFGTTTLTSVAGDDIFVAKLNSVGTCEWAVSVGGTFTDAGLGLALDAFTGDVLVGGSFDSPDLTFGFTRLVNAGGGGFGNSDAFVARISSAGNWRLATRLGSTAADVINSVATDRAGNIYVTGSFIGTIVLGTSSFTSIGGRDMFAAKLDAIGQCQWGQAAGGFTEDAGTDIAVDSVGNVFVAGQFLSPTISFGALTLGNYNPFDYDLFVTRISPNGSWLWATIAGGSDSEKVGWLALDRFDNVYVSGGFRSPQSSFGPLSLLNTSANNYDTFVAKLNSRGIWQWVTGAGSSLSDYASAITLDATDSPVIAGVFAGPSATFGTQTITNGSVTGAEVFVARLSAAGVWNWAVAAGGAGADFGTDIALDNNGNIYVVGRYGGPEATFGATQLTSPATTRQTTAFVARLGGNRVGLADDAPALRATLAPTPAHETVWVSGAARATPVYLLDALGRAVTRAVMASPEGTATLDLRGLPAGLYLVRSGAQTQRLLVQ